jgi:DNA-binding winged helix-turn-helix (wHTH) protein
MTVRTGAPGTLVARRPSPHVEILRWPAHADRREDLLDAGRPCLWVLGPGELPPPVGPLEDWARVGDDERDVEARLRRLAGQAPATIALEPGLVRVGDNGILRLGDRQVRVPPTEAALLDRLGQAPEEVVGRVELAEAAWGTDPHRPGSLDARIHTLRKRIAPLGLTIHAIRGHGFLLAAEPTQSQGPALERDVPRRTSWSSSSPPS